MKSILFINYEYPPVGAGAANANYYFAINMVKKGIRTSVLTSAYKTRHGRAVEKGVTIYRIPAFRMRADQSSIFQMILYGISALAHLPYVLSREHPDALIIFFSFPCGPIALIARGFWKIPYALLLRGGDVPGSDARLTMAHKLLMPIRRQIYRRSAAIIANSEGLKNLALKADPGFRIDVVKNGVDTVFYSPPEQPPVADGHFRFIFVGRFCEQKNIGVLITAFAACLSRCPAVRLVLLGNGPHYSQLKSLAGSLRIDGYVTWAGWRSKNEVRAFYRSSHCLVNPSVNEGMPNTVLEAMACGLPVLGSDCIGNRDIIVNGENGFLFEPRNQVELADKMAALANDRSIGIELGVKGRKMCCERFSWQAVTAELHTIISEKASVR